MSVLVDPLEGEHDSAWINMYDKSVLRMLIDSTPDQALMCGSISARWSTRWRVSTISLETTAAT